MSMPRRDDAVKKLMLVAGGRHATYWIARISLLKEAGNVAVLDV